MAADLAEYHDHKDIHDAHEVPAATRIALLEAELAQSRAALAAAQHQANLVPQLLTVMAQLAQQHSPATACGELASEHLAALTPAHQAMLAAASGLLPQADSLSSSQGLDNGDTSLSQWNAMPYTTQDMSTGEVQGAAPADHLALQHAVDGLAAAVAAGYMPPGELSRKRKADGSFGRGAPGQRRFCPLCKNTDGTPTPLAGNHNATCPWCKKCWAKKQRVLKADCTIHNHSLDGMAMSTHPSMLRLGSEAHGEHEQYPQHDPHDPHSAHLHDPHLALHHMQHDPHAPHMDHLHEDQEQLDPHHPHHHHQLHHHSLHHHAGLHGAEAGYHDALSSGPGGHHHALHEHSLVHDAALHAAHQL